MSKLQIYSFAIIIILTFIHFPKGALAHTDNSEGYSNVTFEEQGLRYELELDYLELSRLIHFGVTPDSTVFQMRQALKKNQHALKQYLQSKLFLYNHNAPIQGKIIDTDVKKEKGRHYAKIVLHFPLKNPNSAAIQITYDIFFDDNDPMHRNIASYHLGNDEGQFVFNSGERQLQVKNETFIGQCLKFIQLGFHHILIGLDHILFIIALAITSRTTTDVLKVVTLFTLAHSVTIGLTALNLLTIPSEIIEPLIALSIAFVSIERFFGLSSIYRYSVVFIFGLIHGIGFAGALHMFEASIWKSLIPILSFNLGVEAGQALIIACLFPLLVFSRVYPWSIPVHGVVSASIFIIGLSWYFQRIFA